MVYGAFNTCAFNKNKEICDEWYTRAEDVKRILDKFDLTGLKIYCPCDSDKSEWVKYLKNVDCELRHSSDDYKNHSDDLEWCDIVITNPPFSKFAEFYKWCVNKNIIIVCSALSAHTCVRWRPGDIVMLDTIRYFNKPDGSVKNAPTVVGCNLEVLKKYGKERCN